MHMKPSTSNFKEKTLPVTANISYSILFGPILVNEPGKIMCLRWKSA